VHHYELESKAQSMAWKRMTSPVAKKFKSQLSDSEIMLTIFGRMEAVILVYFSPKGETVNSQNYCDMLRKKLKAAVGSKRRGKLRKHVILLHDNARPRTANQTVETVSELGFELMEHPPYSPDLAPNDFHVFGPMKEVLKGRRFPSDEDVFGLVQNLLKIQPKVFLFVTEFKKKKSSVKHWNLYVEAEGDYVKK
jgi:histone-lysine N-methyltransferase SETMAR